MRRAAGAGRRAAGAEQVQLEAEPPRPPSRRTSRWRREHYKLQLFPLVPHSYSRTLKPKPIVEPLSKPLTHSHQNRHPLSPFPSPLSFHLSRSLQESPQRAFNARARPHRNKHPKLPLLGDALPQQAIICPQEGAARHVAHLPQRVERVAYGMLRDAQGVHDRVEDLLAARMDDPMADILAFEAVLLEEAVDHPGDL